MSAPILRLPASQRPVFLLNSRLDLFTAALFEHPFSRSYGVILPSSLTRVLPRVFGSSPRLPVSVSGTGTPLLARGFSWQFKSGNFGTFISLPFTAQHHVSGFSLTDSLAAWTCSSIRTLPFPSCVPPSLKWRAGGTGLSTCCPSPTPFGLGLGPDLP